MNLANEIRFGPDIEWLDAPNDLDEADPDFWAKLLEPNETRHDEVFRAVKSYLPGVEREGFTPDCERFLTFPFKALPETFCRFWHQTKACA